MHVIELVAENFKRIVLVRTPIGPGVTPIVGKNGAGKSSLLDAVACALGGSGRAPEVPIRAGAEFAEVVVKTSEYEVRRRWTADGRSTLDVIGTDGARRRSPQAVLDQFCSDFMFDPLAFDRMKPKDQAATLARLVGADLDAHQAERSKLFDQRAGVNRSVKELRGALALMAPVPDGTPDEEVSVTAILDELKAAEQAQREHDLIRRTANAADAKAREQTRRVESLRRQLAEEEAALKIDSAEAASAGERLAKWPAPPDQEPIRERGKTAEGLNKAVRAKQLRANREKEVAAREADADGLTAAMAELDRAFAARLSGAAIPVPGLALTDAGVTLDGVPFAQCSSAQRLRASVLIGLAQNPKLPLMLVRDGSLLDADGMRELGRIADKHGAQILVERVDNGQESGVRIVDGHAEDSPAADAKAA